MVIQKDMQNKFIKWKSILKQEIKVKLHFLEEKEFQNIVYVSKANHENGLIEISKANYKKTLQDMTFDYVELHAKIGTPEYSKS